jgi:Uri superfamily endonuclease
MKQPGTYILVLENRRRKRIRVGRLGLCDFAQGWYLYVGSAFGPGGVAARCGHHRRISQRPRWHIDYLRAKSVLRQIWYSHDPCRREHEWAGLLANQLGLSQPIPGFGASDCQCGSHLFVSAVKPDCGAFEALAGEYLDGHKVIYCKTV